MKKWMNEASNMFALLMAVCVIAMTAGAYLGVTLGVLGPVQSAGRTSGPMALMAAFSIISLAMWETAWAAFFGLCGHLRRGNSAFCLRSDRALGLIGRCMAVMCVLTLVQGLLTLRGWDAYGLIGVVILPGIFGAVAVAAHALRALLRHAMELEAEQEGVV